MTKSNRITARSIAPAASAAEAEDLISQIGTAQTEAQRLQGALDEDIRNLRTRYQALMDPLNAQITDNVEAVRMWAEANRATLLNGKTKSAQLTTGKISWRKLPDTITVRNAESVIAYLEGQNLGRFLRVKKEVDKAAMLKELDVVEGIKGITVKPGGEQIAIVPHSSQLEIATATTEAEKVAQ